MRRGFTLIELCFVIAILGVLTAVTVPAYGVIHRRAQAAEARAMLSAIAHAELRHHRDTGVLLPCGPTASVGKTPVAFPNGEACWQALHIQVGGAVRYQYAVALDGDSFVVTAVGDLDGDGKRSTLRLDGRNLHIETTDGLE